MTGLRFNGSGSEFFKIWIVNVLLTIVTIGLYYPWAKVRTKRYFYGNTTLENNNFEYHATGKQLFVSYLIAMGLLIIYFIVEQISVPLSTLMFVIFLIGLPWIIWRSLMFNMRITSFANVRFKFTGKLSDAYMVYIIYPGILILLALIIAVVIGGFAILILIPFYIFAFAYIKKKVTEYKMNHAKYGQGQFNCYLQLKPLVMITLKTFGIFILATLLSIGFASLFISFSDLATLAQNPELMSENSSTLALLVFVVYAGFLFTGLLTYAYSASRYRNYIYENLTLDRKIDFHSSLSARTLAWIVFSNLILLVITLGLALPWTKVRLARAFVENTHVRVDEGLNSYIDQAQAQQSAFGEQVGDAFDVDAGIAL